MTAGVRPAAVLFDLDGTLLDTAPDFVLALNALRVEEGLTALSLDDIRPHVSHGSPALIRVAFGADDDQARFDRRRLRLLDLYAATLAQAAQLFPGMDEVLDTIEQRGLVWGIVTNKPTWLTTPLLQAFKLGARAGCVIAGDSAARAKPFPDPLLAAARVLGCAPARCLYLGDAERDVTAARAAGMTAVIALYGYLGIDDQPHCWGGDGVINAPRDLLTWI